MSNKGDYTIENHGSILLFRPITKAAKKWLFNHTDGCWFGNALSVEPRYAQGLIEGLEENGFYAN